MSHPHGADLYQKYLENEAKLDAHIKQLDTNITTTSVLLFIYAIISGSYKYRLYLLSQDPALSALDIIIAFIYLLNLAHTLSKLRSLQLLKQLKPLLKTPQP